MVDNKQDMAAAEAFDGGGRWSCLTMTSNLCQQIDRRKGHPVFHQPITVVVINVCFFDRRDQLG